MTKNVKSILGQLMITITELTRGMMEKECARREL